eukprot:12463042-Heterocapsa_arctica.AAC.1
MPCQTYEFKGEDKQNKSTISVLLCNINRWGAHENHYDLLILIKEEEQTNTTIEYIFLDNMKEDKISMSTQQVTIPTTLAGDAKLKWKEALTLLHSMCLYHYRISNGSWKPQKIT